MPSFQSSTNWSIDMEDERTITAVASRIKEAFSRLKSKKLGGRKYRPNERHNKPEFWRLAAKQCIALEADPEDYVAAAFEQCKMREGPFTNNMFGAAAKKWYLRFRACRPEVTAQTNYVDPVAQLATAPQPTEWDKMTPAEQDLQLDFETAESVFWHATGGSEGGNISSDTPEAREACRSWFGPIGAHVRVLIGFGDPVVLKRHGEAALAFYETKPNYLAAAVKRGYNMQEIMQWMRSRTP